MNPVTTIIVEPESTDMTILETVKEELNKTDERDDEKIGRYIRQASLTIRRYLNRDLAQATVTDSFRVNRCRTWGQDAPALLLSRWPVVSVDSVIEADATIDTDGWQIDNSTGEIWRLSNDTRIGWGVGRTDITYTGGYIMLTDLPEDLEQACIALVTANWFRSGRDPLVKQESIPGVIEQNFWIGGVGDNAAIGPEVCALLDPYRRISI